MRMKRSQRGGSEPLRIEGEMTIYSAAALAQRLTATIADASGRPRLDLSQVSEIDTAGLQVLLMARKLARARGGLSVVAASARVQALLRLCGLEDMIEGHPGPASAS
ncbi:MAG TPA: STAS domain-containing protein [Steroidobacteraceae bacterium]|nr:STAS domain-containing protein [Steroidobacteraceae bacterium]